jgi:hypothetical protein
MDVVVVFTVSIEGNTKGRLRANRMEYSTLP